MEHIVRSLNKAPELSDYIEEGYDDVEEGEEHDSMSSEAGRRIPSLREEPESPGLQDGEKLENAKVTPEMESQFFAQLASSRAGSRLSIADVADRHLRDKTDAIAYIIRNISDQCAAAVEGLHLAHNAENEDHDHLDPELASSKSSHKHTTSDGDVSMHTDVSQLGAAEDNGEELDSGHGGSTGFLTPHEEMAGRQSRTSSIPPTPDLIGGRSSTSMSGYSNSTVPTQGRDSHQWQSHHDAGKSIKVVDSDEPAQEEGSESGQHESDQLVGKRGSEVRPVTARMVAA